MTLTTTVGQRVRTTTEAQVAVGSQNATIPVGTEAIITRMGRVRQQVRFFTPFATQRSHWVDTTSLENVPTPAGYVETDDRDFDNWIVGDIVEFPRDYSRRVLAGMRFPITAIRDIFGGRYFDLEGGITSVRRNSLVRVFHLESAATATPAPDAPLVVGDRVVSTEDTPDGYFPIGQTGVIVTLRGDGEYETHVRVDDGYCSRDDDDENIGPGQIIMTSTRRLARDAAPLAAATTTESWTRENALEATTEQRRAALDAAGATSYDAEGDNPGRWSYAHIMRNEVGCCIEFRQPILDWLNANRPRDVVAPIAPATPRDAQVGDRIRITTFERGSAIGTEGVVVRRSTGEIRYDPDGMPRSERGYYYATDGRYEILTETPAPATVWRLATSADEVKVGDKVKFTPGALNHRINAGKTALLGVEYEITTAGRFGTDHGIIAGPNVWATREEGHLARFYVTDASSAVTATTTPVVEEIQVDDPRLAHIWKKAAEKADEQGYCSEYERLVDLLGIPGREKDRYVTIKFGADIEERVQVRATSQRDAEAKVAAMNAREKTALVFKDLSADDIIRKVARMAAITVKTQ